MKNDIEIEDISTDDGDLEDVLSINKTLDFNEKKVYQTIWN